MLDVKSRDAFSFQKYANRELRTCDAFSVSTVSGILTGSKDAVIVWFEHWCC